MLTRKGFWMLAAVLAVIGPSVLFGAQNSLLLGLTVLMWMSFLWGKFALETQLLVPKLMLERTLDGQPIGRTAVHLGRELAVRVRLHAPTEHELATIFMSDRVPANTHVDGSVETRGVLRAAYPLEVHYTVRPLVPGIIRFEGVRLELLDRQGFFRHRWFLRQPQEATVLPSYRIDKDAKPLLKTRNVLPTHGIHRHKMPGSGTELLDLRDYVPGDPPKTIAWKVSARRDRLVTKEYESEVPVRCTIFFDASDSVKASLVREAPITQSAELAATLARKLLSHRDPVGLCIFDEAGSTVLVPSARGGQHAQILAALAKAAAQPPAPRPTDPAGPFDAAYRLADEVYPQLLHKAERWKGSWWRDWPFSLARFNVFLGIVCLGAVGMMYPPGTFQRAMILMAAAMALAGLAVHTVVRRWRKKNKKGTSLTYQRRKSLASVLTAWDHAEPGLAPVLAADNFRLSKACQRFCHAHRVPVHVPLYSATGDYLWKQPGKLDVLARCLLNAGTRGKDNELFVLFVDLLEVVDEAKSLLRSIKVVQAKHHQVLVICPWPRGLEPPDAPEWVEQADQQLLSGEPIPRAAVDVTMRAYERKRYRQAFNHLNGQLKQAGVPLICATATDAVVTVLDQVERLRAGRSAVTARYRR